MSIIICLMGVSSVGKSSVANALKDKLGKDFVIVGFDHAVEDLDKKYWPGGSHEKEGFFYEEHKIENELVPELKHGKVGEEFLEKMWSDIINLSKSGKNLIFDQVIPEEDMIKLTAELKDVTFFQVGLKPPLDEVIKREISRGDRKVGIAKSMYEEFYNNKKFDLEINTKDVSAEKSAAIISELINTPSNTFRIR